MKPTTLIFVSLAIAPVVSACPWEIHPTTASDVPAQTAVQMPAAAGGLNDVPVIPWKLNYNSLKGSSPNTTINNFVSQINADVQEVWYDANYAYVKTTDVPSHSVGPFPDGNPAYPSNINKTLRITRTPIEATNKVSTGLGAIGVMANGVFIYNALDAMSYNNAGVWYRNANVFEAGGFDSGPGHPSPLPNTSGNPRPGQYHYHQGPSLLLNQMDSGNTGQHHSPLIGFAFDGFPIYGPYGFTDPANANSGIKRIISSFKIRDDVAAGLRNTLTDGGTVLSASQRGPAVSSAYPAGAYIQDWEYTAGVGDLNQYNMRFTVTPEYPNGTWAYFATYDSAGKAAYPYLIGPQYFGVVDTANMSGATIPATATKLKVGDLNLDSSVNSLDFNAFTSGFGATHSGLWTNGDLNRDGKVSTVDFNYFAAHFGGSAAASLGATVPEPSLGGIALGNIMLILRRRRR